MVICDFKNDENQDNWKVINDAVMGGLSDGQFSFNDKNTAVFEGKVSLENNGGFSMVQHKFPSKSVDKYSKFVIHLKGDRKTYQFRGKTSVEDNYSYVCSFETSGHWETIEIPFNMMYPAYRGRQLKAANYPGNHLEMIAFLIGNKTEETFKLKIKTIALE